MKKLKKRKKSLKVLMIPLVIVIICVCFGVFYSLNNSLGNDNVAVDYSKYYSQYAKVNGEQKLYELIDSEYIEKGKIHNGIIVELEKLESKDSPYFKIKNINSKYYIKYDSIEKSENGRILNDRYKNYIPYNKNVITKNIVTLYNNDGNKVYTINEILNLPIIVKDGNKYFVEFDDMLLYILKDDINEIVESSNSNINNTNGVPILNYHFVYKPEFENCSQEICHTEEQFRTHLSYIKENGYFTPTMEELEKYIDGKLQLPKSVVITIDDGRNVNIATNILEEYQLNATAFIVTSRYDVENDFVKSKYVELQSHSHKLHDAGTCPSGHGQGGGLTCLSDDVVLNDLKTSRKILNNATAFCYPFYEYNNHSIELLKQAGYTMAFAGEYTGGKTKAEVGIDKFRIPRWVIVNYTTMDDFISYVSGAV